MSAVLNHRATTTTEWVLCDGCHCPIYKRRMERSLGVCPECGRHRPLSAPDRLAQLLDAGSADWLDLPAVTEDPLRFRDAKPYPRRLAAARATTGLAEAALAARGTIEGIPVITVVMDFRFLGGSLGCAVGELVTTAAELALRERSPLLIVTASGGARMQEGVLSLMQMAKTSQAMRQLDEAGVLTVSLITDPTYGGVAASFATLCDVIAAEPGARLGFAGPRVIAQTIRQELPAGFQTSERLLEQGMIDLLRPRPALRSTLARLLAVGRPRVSGPSAADRQRPTDALIRDPGAITVHEPWQAVRHARDIHRPTTLDYVGRVFDDFLELRGDRHGGDCPAVIGGLAYLEGRPVMTIGHQKGHTVSELVARNYGMATPAGYRKAARLMRLAAKHGLPVVTLVDTPGAYPGVSAEERGQAVAIAENLRLMSGLPVPIITVITGEGGSGGALALAVADRVLAFAQAVYSVISPEGCAAILWGSAELAPAAAAALRIGTRDLLAFGVVDAVIPEPPGGTQADPELAAERLRDALRMTLAELATEPTAVLEARRARLRRSGALAHTTREAEGEAPACER